MLSESRTRVAEHGLEEAALDGLLKARGKQRTDFAHVVVAVRGLHTIELAGESVQAALAAACPDWLTARLCAGTGPAGTAPSRLLAPAGKPCAKRRRALRPARGPTAVSLR